MKATPRQLDPFIGWLQSQLTIVRDMARDGNLTSAASMLAMYESLGLPAQDAAVTRKALNLQGVQQ